MQVPIGWLNEYIPVDYNIDELGRKLTSIGLESERFTPEPLGFTNVFIGKIIARENTPDGRGFIYTVEVGNTGGAFASAKATIFSTIPTLKVGVKYPVALPGGHVGDLEIGERQYETFTSRGKFCCATELGLTKLEFVEHSDGTVDWKDGLEDTDGRALSIFPDCGDLELGTDLAKWLLNDPATTIELTSNRGDCHCMLGVAREMQVITGTAMTMPRLAENIGEVKTETPEITILIDDPAGCMLYAGLIIDNIRMAPSPLWLAKKLLSVGLRPISNIVDITNLVLYEVGQPLHAFDYSLIKGQKIIVRRAKPGESMPTIDGVVRNLTPEDLVIADSENPVAIAGVMGGFASEVTGETKKVLLESAWFDPISIRRTSRRLALRTEAAIRFERGIDPEGIVRAVKRVAYLVNELKCGRPADAMVVTRARKFERTIIKIRESQITSLLGEEIPTGQIEMILQNLGFWVDGSAANWEITVPTFRPDIFIAEDIIEEIARHVGYDNFAEKLPMIHMRTGLVDEDIRLRLEIKRYLAGLGLWELNSFPLQADAVVLRPNPLIPDGKSVKIINPITEDASNLRLSLVPGVVETFIRNLKRGAAIHDVFEIGNVYWYDGDDYREHREIIIGCLGDRTGKKKLRNREKGFIELKGYVEEFFDIVGINGYDLVSDDSASSGNLKFNVMRGGETIGVYEMTHEDTLDGETFERPVFTFAMPWKIARDAYLGSSETQSFKQLPTYPAADRDLAFVLDESVAYRRMLESIKSAAGDYLIKIEVFDVYRGEQVGENKKNLAVSLRFRHPERTLTDEEIDGWIANVVSDVGKNTGGTLRSW
ncbi:MAG: phenylalanine--tRNA ligase subunit beta [bacterium]|nr:phenylalanine--tRNA ligase subunit beta [bacterium]